MHIENISITDIPRDHMEKLASIVTDTIWIDNMTHNNQLGSILASVNCPELQLCNMYLSEAETWALVAALSDKVKSVHLQDVTLDMEEFNQFGGQGRCDVLMVEGNTVTRYGDRFERWAADKGWTVTAESYEVLVMERI